MNLNLLNNNHLELYSKQIDLQLILEDIQKLLHFDSNKSSILGEISYLSKDQITQNYDSLDYLIKKIDEGQYPLLRAPFHIIGQDQELYLILSRLSKQSVLDIREVNHILLHYEAFQELSGLLQLKDSPPSAPQALNKVKNQFRDFVDQSGSVDFNRHPKLAPKYKELTLLEQQIRNNLKNLMISAQYEKIIRFNEFDLINDHYVIPIRSDSYQAGLGQIIAHSDSGMTLYIEPFSVRDQSNKRLTLMAEIEELIFNICKEFSSSLYPHTDFFRAVRLYFEQIDMSLAKAFYSYDKQFNRPQISDKFEIELYNAYHPFIPNPVKNDISLKETDHGMIISGPNTGGKTVTLKTIALCQLFLHIGIFVPADAAILYPYEGLYFFGNDEQNLREGLSSFAAETKSYLQLLGQLKASSLIFVDEIFNSTSSEEASALAMGLFSEIQHLCEAKVLVSTHHQMLKTLMQQEASYKSCHVGYDLKLDRPTYKLIDGLPGSSMALTIFSHLSKKYYPNHAIVDKAKSVLDTKYQSYEKLLLDVSQKQIALDKLLDKNKTINKDLTQKSKSLDGVLKLKLQQKLDHYENKFHKFIHNADKYLAEAKKNDTSPKSFVKGLDEIKRSFQKQKEDMVPDQSSSNKSSINQDIGKRPSHFEIEKSYYSTTLNSMVLLKEIDQNKKIASVAKGAFNMKVPLHTLRENKNPALKKTGKQHVQVIMNASEDYLLEIDCRGMRLDEFASLVEKKMDELLRGDIPFLNIIHGHGEGILKQWLRGYLNKHDEYSWGAENEFNDGSTRVTLKK